MLTLIPVSLAQANEFVRQHHRHHPGGGPPGPLDQDAPEPAGKDLAESPQGCFSQAEEPGPVSYTHLRAHET